MVFDKKGYCDATLPRRYTIIIGKVIPTIGISYGAESNDIDKWSQMLFPSNRNIGSGMRCCNKIHD